MRPVDTPRPMSQADATPRSGNPSIRAIRLFVFDVDGTLTDGTIRLRGDGVEEKVFHAHDGAGIALLRHVGVEPAIASGRDSAATAARARELGITRVAQGVANKVQLVSAWCNELEIRPAQAAFMGDDLGDARAMANVGYSAAPANAVRDAKAAATYVCQRHGGDGAVREAIEDLIGRMGRWSDVLTHYGLAGATAVHA